MAASFFAKTTQKSHMLASTIASIAVLAVWASTASAQNIVPTAEPENAELKSLKSKGVANYASYIDKSYAMNAAATLEQTLASKVLIAQVEIDGQAYLRLRSVAMDSVNAKSLVVRATAVGYPAWYQTAPVTKTGEARIDARNSTNATKQRRNANPKLVAMLPEGPLLGELYPPRTPTTGR